MLDVESVLGLPYSASSLPFRNKGRLVEVPIASRAWTTVSVWQLHRTGAFDVHEHAPNFNASPALRDSGYNALRARLALEKGFVASRLYLPS